MTTLTKPIRRESRQTDEDQNVMREMLDLNHGNIERAARECRTLASRTYDDRTAFRFERVADMLSDKARAKRNRKRG